MDVSFWPLTSSSKTHIFAVTSNWVPPVWEVDSFFKLFPTILAIADPLLKINHKKIDEQTYQFPDPMMQTFSIITITFQGLVANVAKN